MKFIEFEDLNRLEHYKWKAPTSADFVDTGLDDAILSAAKTIAESYTAAMGISVGDVVHTEYGNGVVVGMELQQGAIDQYVVALFDKNGEHSTSESNQVCVPAYAITLICKNEFERRLDEMAGKCNNGATVNVEKGMIRKRMSSTEILNYAFDNFLDDVKDIHFSGPATIVFWKDGTKTVVKCQEGEYYDPKEGIKYALLKKLAGGTSNQASKKMDKFDEWLEKWVPEDLKSETDESSKDEDPFESMAETTNYVIGEMKKRLGKLGELADRVHFLNDKIETINEELKDTCNDKPEETEEK